MNLSLIDLSVIDANTKVSGNQAFAFVDNALTPTVNPGVKANSVTWYQDTTKNETIVQIDTTGDTTADMVIHLSGLQALTAANLIL